MLSSEGNPWGRGHPGSTYGLPPPLPLTGEGDPGSVGPSLRRSLHGSQSSDLVLVSHRSLEWDHLLLLLLFLPVGFLSPGKKGRRRENWGPGKRGYQGALFSATPAANLLATNIYCFLEPQENFTSQVLGWVNGQRTWSGRRFAENR